MASASNPYTAPNSKADSHARRESSLKRRMAIGFILLPFVIALPLRYWVFNHDGSWFVSTELESDHRRAFLGIMYISLALSFAVLSFFPAAILLWRDRFYPALSFITAIILGILAVPAVAFLAIGISSYFQFG